MWVGAFPTSADKTNSKSHSLPSPAPPQHLDLSPQHSYHLSAPTEPLLPSHNLPSPRATSALPTRLAP